MLEKWSHTHSHFYFRLSVGSFLSGWTEGATYAFLRRRLSGGAQSVVYIRGLIPYEIVHRLLYFLFLLIEE